MKEARRIAKDLDYRQRKALRRLGKGKSITRAAARDPLLSQYFRHNIPKPPRGNDLNVVSWCDWESTARGAKPQLSELGEAVYKELLKLDDERKLNGTF